MAEINLRQLSESDLEFSESEILNAIEKLGYDTKIESKSKYLRDILLDESKTNRKK